MLQQTSFVNYNAKHLPLELRRFDDVDRDGGGERLDWIIESYSLMFALFATLSSLSSTGVFDKKNPSNKVCKKKPVQ